MSTSSLRPRGRFLVRVVLPCLLLTGLFGMMLAARPVQAQTNRAAQQITSFTLINAHDQSVIGTITDNYLIDCASIGTLALNIRANPSPATVGSVVFGLDGNTRYRVENNPPYSIGGNTNGKYNAWKPVDGTHFVTATPYTLKNGTGIAGTPLTVQISAANCVEPTITPTFTSTATMAVTATPTLTATATATATGTATDTATIVPTGTPTDVPPTSTTTLEPGSTATATKTTTVTRTPTTTQTPTSVPEVELVDNGSFEVDTTGDKIPDGWSLKNFSRDKRICNRAVPPKVVAMIGECAFQFKAVPHENSKLVQFLSLPPALNSGDSVRLVGYIQAKGAVNVVVKVNIKYSDGFLTQGKIKLPVNTVLPTYTAFADLANVQTLSYTLIGTPLKLKLLVANKGTSGKVRFDGVSLLMTESTPAILFPLPLP